VIKTLFCTLLMMLSFLGLALAWPNFRRSGGSGTLLAAKTNVSESVYINASF
jgi:hypothetical protein